MLLKFLNRFPVGFLLTLGFAGILFAAGVTGLISPMVVHSTPQPDEPHTYVSRILDGDTFDLSSGERIRIYSVDTPELATEDYGLTTRDALRNLIGNAEVRLIRQGVDRYGRTLACVYTRNGESVDNYLLSLPGVRKWEGVSCPASY